MTIPTPTMRRPLIERVLGPFERFAAKESAGGVVLLLCTVVALVWANAPGGESYMHLWETPLSIGVGPWSARFTLHAAINDGLMAVFFFLVGLEIKRETLVGELASLRRAALPLAGAIGGMVFPAIIYTVLNAGGPGARGWGIPTATDIAFALGVLALAGDRVPASLRVFLTALAIADDIGAVLVIAIFYSAGVAWGALAAAGALLALAFGANAAGVRKPWVYALIGVALWIAVIYSGVHATVAGVLLAFAIPARTRIDETQFLEGARGAITRFDDAIVCAPGTTVLSNADSQEALHSLERLTEQAQAPLQRLVHSLHGVVAFGIMPLFALSNAGVVLTGNVTDHLSSPVTLGIILGLVVGKPLGITLVAWFAVRVGLAERPGDASWAMLHAVSWLGGIGFTMSLFVSGLAFDGGGAGLQDSAKLGILAASSVAAVVGLALLRRLRQP